MMRVTWLMLVAAALSLGGCASDPSGPGAPEAISLLGEPLRSPDLPTDVLLERSSELNTAHNLYLMSPDHEMTAIWFGRRLAYLGRYHESIEVYGRSLEQHPESYRLRRHRGHRYITIRRFDDALADLSRAAELIEGKADEVEIDGLPNALGIPRSTTHSNIFYHLGLVHYLRGDYERARQAYLRGLEFSTNDDMRCATIYWLVLSLHRLGLGDVAEPYLEEIRPDMEIIENFAYHKLLLMFRGELAEGDLRTEGEDDIQNSTTAYGIAAWRLVNGDRDAALELCRSIVQGPQWAAFGHIAAEAELARFQAVPPGSENGSHSKSGLSDRP